MAPTHAYQRSVYVVTLHGEVGPTPVAELPELLERGEIGPGDQVRTGFGAVLGTVEEVLSANADSESDQSELDEAPKRSPGSSHSLFAKVLITALVVVTIALVLMQMSSRQSTSVTAPAGPTTHANVPHVFTLVAGAGVGNTQIIEVHLDERPAKPVSVLLSLIPPIPGVEWAPPGPLVQIAPGELRGQATLRWWRSDPRPVVAQVQGQIANNANLAPSPTLAVTIVERVPPSVAHEPFVGPGTGDGWSSPWRGSLQFKNESISLGDDPKQGAITSYAQLINEGDQGIHAIRDLAQTLERGTVWMSFVVNPSVGKDGSLQWAAVSFTNGEKQQFSISCAQALQEEARWGLIVPNADNRENRWLRLLPNSTPARLVVRLDLNENSAGVTCWINPEPGREPQMAKSRPLNQNVSMVITGIRLRVDGSGKLTIADLRIGRQYQEVVPAW